MPPQQQEEVPPLWSRRGGHRVEQRIIPTLALGRRNRARDGREQPEPSSHHALSLDRANHLQAAPRFPALISGSCPLGLPSREARARLTVVSKRGRGIAATCAEAFVPTNRRTGEPNRRLLLVGWVPDRG